MTIYSSKYLTLVLIFFAYSSFCQEKHLISSPGLYHSFQWIPADGNAPSLSPQLWFYHKNLYFETRFNYEYSNTTTFLGGYSHKNRDSSVENIMMGGITIGDTAAFILSDNIILNKANYNLESDNEWVRPVKYGNNQLFYDWTKLTFNTKCSFISPGVSAQVKLFNTPFVYLGPMLKLKLHENLGIDLFGYYDFTNKQPVWSMALDFESK